MPQEITIIDRFDFATLPANTPVLVAYEPQRGPYANKHYVIRYISPDEFTAQFTDGATALCRRELHDLPGKALYSSMVEVTANGRTRDVPKISKEFVDVFKAAILNNEGTVAVNKDGSLVDVVDEF